jgi:hypothetical protein
VSFRLVPNPAFVGSPRIIDAVCHDRTPFLTVHCSCGAEMHIHESQIAGLEDTTIASFCKGCRGLLEFPPGFIAGAFEQMRADGWIARKAEDRDLDRTHDYRCSDCGRRGHNARTCDAAKEEIDG